MAVIFPISDADFDALPVQFRLGVSDGLVAMGFPNRSSAKVARNLADGSDMTILGSPTVNSTYSAFSAGTSYIDSGAADTAAVSVLVACKTPETGISAPIRPSYLGNQSSGQASLDDSARLSTGIQLYALSSTQMVWSTCRITGPGTGSTAVTTSNWILSVPDVSSWAFYSARSDDTRQNLKDITRGLAKTDAVLSGRTRLRSPGNYRVGSAANSNEGVGHIAFWAVFNRYITDAEETTIYTAAKTYLATKSITI